MAGLNPDNFPVASLPRCPVAPLHRFPVLSVVASLLFVIGCGNDNGEIGNYRYRSDMHAQPSYRKHEDPRTPVKNTVPVKGFVEAVRDSAAAAKLINPVKLSAANADSGRFLFQAYCSPCHGLGAKGDGLVAAKFQVPPDLTAAKYQKAPDGYIYYVIRNGRLIMPPHYEAVSPRERWLVVNHLRALQQQQ
ncbi:MAG: cytochrome c [Ignavibacteriales bacterium]|nr:cytochrome c [Ignavibacteriales bacterium]